MTHDCCLRTLFLAESNSSKRQSQLTLESLFFTMKRFAVTSPEKPIDWKDSRLYGGGVHGFQGSDKWEALYGYEVCYLLHSYTVRGRSYLSNTSFPP